MTAAVAVAAHDSRAHDHASVGAFGASVADRPGPAEVQ